MGNSTPDKQSFRSRSTAEGDAQQPTGPAYPTLESGRRRFLRRFGLAAGGTLGLLVVGCTLEDDEHGSPPRPNIDWRRDVRRPDAGPPDTVHADTLDADALDAGTDGQSSGETDAAQASDAADIGSRDGSDDSKP